MSSNDSVDLEDIAALIDGRLAGAERQRVVERLAEDEESYELFAEVLRFQEEEEQRDEAQEGSKAEGVSGEVVPIESRRPVSAWRRWAPAAALAAAAMVALVIGVPRLMTAPTDSRSLLAGGLAADTPALSEEWYSDGKNNLRGAEVRGVVAQVEFQLGVEVVDLRIALATRDLSRAKTVISRLINLLENGADGINSLLAFGYGELDSRLEVDGIHDDLIAESSRVEEEIETILESLYFDFGRWVEAGRLAATMGHGGYFLSRATRQMLRRLDDAGLSGEVSDRVEAIRQLSVGGDLSDEALEKIGENLTEVAKRSGAYM